MPSGVFTIKRSNAPAIPTQNEKTVWHSGPPRAGQYQPVANAPVDIKSMSVVDRVFGRQRSHPEEPVGMFERVPL